MSSKENDFKKEEETHVERPRTTSTTSEKEARIQKSLADYEKDGLTPNAIMFGILNLVMVFFWLGHSPATYWILVMIKGTFFLYSTWKLKFKTRTDLFYMTEFCWVACHIYLIFLWLGLFAIKWEWFKDITYNRTAFYAFWGFANGSFGFSAIAF